MDSRVIFPFRSGLISGGAANLRQGSQMNSNFPLSLEYFLNVRYLK